LIFLVSFFITTGTPGAVNDTPGSIWGTLLLDSTWERKVYMSYIETMEQKYTVSNDIIFASSGIDSLNRFSFLLDKIPSGWSLLRLHVVKKGSPPASLIIGGADENFYFIIAKPESKIEFLNSPGNPVFKKVYLSGAPYMKTLDFITNLSNYPNSLNLENSPIEREFIEEVISEKLKRIADTCTNPLVSLFAIYMTDFNTDYKDNPAYYNLFLSKWKDENNSYFKSFEKQLPETKVTRWPYILVISLTIILVPTLILINSRKKRRLRTLSVQERKILELLQKGASNQEISDEYNIELSTVKSHVSSIFSKLNFKSRKDAMNMKSK
jgi:DNA-binding CsgD family transcriptional regulator